MQVTSEAYMNRKLKNLSMDNKISTNLNFIKINEFKQYIVVKKKNFFYYLLPGLYWKLVEIKIYWLKLSTNWKKNSIYCYISYIILLQNNLGKVNTEPIELSVSVIKTHTNNRFTLENGIFLWKMNEKS